MPSLAAIEETKRHRRLQDYVLEYWTGRMCLQPETARPTDISESEFITYSAALAGSLRTGRGKS